MRTIKLEQPINVRGNSPLVGEHSTYIVEGSFADYAPTLMTRNEVVFLLGLDGKCLKSRGYIYGIDVDLPSDELPSVPPGCITIEIMATVPWEFT